MSRSGRMTSPRLVIPTIEDSDSFFRELQRDTEGFQLLAGWLRELAGIHLPANAKNFCFLASRLNPVLKEHGLRSYGDYFQQVLSRGGREAREQFVSALTTNTTQFFREVQHFESLKKALPELLRQKARRGQSELRVWCAAASTGQEPYTIAIVLKEALQEDPRWKIRMLATDIDLEVLEKACQGTYSASELSHVPPLYRQKYFNGSQASDSIRSIIRFAPFNLLSQPYPFRHPFDIVFCRNVLIYFDAETGSAVINRLAASLAPGGLLFLGHSESGLMRNSSLQTIASATYQKRAHALGIGR